MNHLIPRRRKASAGHRGQPANLRDARRGWRFLGAFVSIWLCLTLALLFLPGVAPWLRANTAWVLGGCLRLVGLPATVRGTLVEFPPAGSFEIITECTALYVAPVFAAGVLAAPVGWPAKLVGILAGVPCLYGLNIARLIVLAFILRHWPGAFRFFHDYIWQVLFGATVIAVWWVWCEAALRRVARPASARG